MSSANVLIFAFSKHLGMSLIYIKNRSGPRVEPCGTQDHSIRGRSQRTWKMTIDFSAQSGSLCWSRHVLNGPKLQKTNCTETFL